MFIDRDAIIKAIELRRAIGDIPAVEAPAVTLPTEEEIARAMWEADGSPWEGPECARTYEVRAVLALLRSRIATATEPDAKPVKPAPAVDHAYSRALRIEVVRAIGPMLTQHNALMFAVTVEDRVRAMLSAAADTERTEAAK